MTRSRWIALAVGVLLIAGASAFVYLRLQEEPLPPPPKASFSSSSTQPVDAQDRAEASERAAAVEAKVLALLNTYYDLAFLDPSIWAPAPEDEPRPGPPPEDQLQALFTQQAGASFLGFLDAMTLGTLGVELERVEPASHTAEISIYFEEDLSAPLVAVSASFQATATVVAEERGFFQKVFGSEPESRVVDLSHGLFLWLQPSGDEYRIAAYRADLRADERIQSAAFGVPADGAPR